MSEHSEDDNLERDEEFEQDSGGGNQLDKVIQVDGMYNEWFLDYASYVILERAVPHMNDGLKPVQRRILHSLRELEDGRYHKVANVIGNTMKFHPHGDAAIGDALVQIGQKGLLFDTQGNWGNTLTGDRAAAPRYIEVRLSKFGNEVMFNAKTTKWLTSYDGRAKEPDTLPAKFPVLLAHGAEGIAVGLACKILPHNFIEIIDASIDALRGKKTKILPDFLTGGMADMSQYNDGLRGGKIRVRARIKKEDDKTLVITEIPFGTTTGSLIDSVLKANDKGKLRVKKIEDNTAENVEIVIHLPNGVSPDKTIDALYAFTSCEQSISPNITVIKDDKPQFLAVSELLHYSALRTKDLLKWELDIRKAELEEHWHFASLEKIFIEKRIYRDIEEAETWEQVLSFIHKGLKPHIKHLLRTVTDEDVTRLTEIKIKRISKFDSFKADEKIAGIETELEEVKFHLANLTDYSVDWFKMLKKKYGEGKERRTEIRSFDTIVAAKAAVANTKLYVNLEEGFAGTGLKKSDSEFVCDCSDIDDIIVFRNNGVMQVSKISTKSFFGKGIIHIAVWKKGDMRTVYNLIYEDGKGGKAMVKRFFVNSITRDKEYQVTKGTEGSKVLYFTSNANAEAEVVQVILKPTARLKRLRFDYDFAELAIKGRASGGNTLSKFQLRRVELKEKGVSTLGARKIWFDPAVTRLNIEGRGNFLGEFQPADKILVILSTGEYHLIGFDLSTHFDDAMLQLEKWIPQKPISAVHYDGEKEAFYVKRFLAEPSSKKVLFISEGENNRLEAVSTAFHPIANLRFNKKFKKTRDKEDEQLDLHKFISVKGLKALGNRLHALPVTEVSMLDADEEREAAALAALQPGKKSDSGEDGSDDNDTEPDDSGSGGDDLPSGDDTPVTAATDNTAPSKGSEKSLTIAEKKAARKKAQAIKAPVQEAALDENTSAKLGASGEAISSSAPEDKTIATQEFADVMAEAKARREANMSAKHSDLRASKKKAPKKTVANKAVPKKIAPKKEDEPLKQNPDDIEMDIDIPEDEDSGGDGGGQGSLF